MAQWEIKKKREETVVIFGCPWKPYCIAVLEHILQCAHVSVYVYVCTVHQPPLARVEKLSLLTVMTRWQVKVKFIFPLFYRKYSLGPQRTHSALRKWKHRRAPGSKAGGGEKGMRRENVLSCQTATMQLLSQFQHFWQTPNCSTYDWISAYWAFSVRWIKILTLYTHHKIFPLNTFYCTSCHPPETLAFLSSFILRFILFFAGTETLYFRWLSFCLNH